MSDNLQLKHPIILIHGLGALGQLGPIEYFYKIPKWLQSHGNRVRVVNLGLWNSVDHCALELNSVLAGLFPGEKLNLLGHSMGGLSARFFASCFDKGERVASVTTVGTPNHGSSIVDHFLELFLDDVMGKTELLAKKFGFSHLGFRQIGKKYFEEHLHLHIQDIPEVAYFSATSIIPSPMLLNCLPTFWATQPILKRYEGENDGFVSEESAQWGTHIATYKGDHYAQIGQPFGRSKLDHLKFFSEIFGHLKKKGF